MKMKHCFVVSIFIGLFMACTSSTEKTPAVVQEQKDVDSAEAPTVQRYLVTDFPDRVYVFRKMADSTVEEQVIKYEKFAVLFIEFAGLYKIEHLYAPSDQERNINAYNVLRDEMVSLKEKLKRSMAQITPSREKRLDAADARMNVYAPDINKK